MLSLLPAGTMSKKKPNESVKLDAEVVRLARIVAAYRELTLAEYLSERLRPLVAADHEEEVQREAKARRR